MSFLSRVFSFGRAKAQAAVTSNGTANLPPIGEKVSAADVSPQPSPITYRELAEAKAQTAAGYVAPVLMPGAAVFAEAVAASIKASKPRPFAAFRGDHRRPPRRRAKPGKSDLGRIYRMQTPPDRASNIAKLQRGLRIIARHKAAAAQAAAQ